MTDADILKKKAKNLIRISVVGLAAIGLVLGTSGLYSAKASGTLQSKGKLIYNNPETGETEVIIDTTDHQLLKDEIDINTQAIVELQNSSEIDIKLIDGVPHWSERGADTWSPFKQDNVTFSKTYLYHSHSIEDNGSTLEFSSRDEAAEYFSNNSMPESQSIQIGCYQEVSYLYSITNTEKVPVYHKNTGVYDGMAYCERCDQFVHNQTSNVCWYETKYITSYESGPSIPDGGTLMDTSYAANCGYRHGELIDVEVEVE